MDVVERIQARFRKEADDAVAEVMAGIRAARDKHAASAAHLRAEIEREEQSIAVLDAEMLRLFPTAAAKRTPSSSI